MRRLKVFVFVLFFCSVAASAQNFRVQYLGVDGTAMKFKKWFSWSAEYSRRIGNNLELGLGYRSYYWFVTPDPKSSSISFEMKNQNGFLKDGTVNLTHDVNWREIFYSVRFYFSSSTDDSWYFSESLGYYRLKTIMDVKYILYDDQYLDALNGLSRGEFTQTNVFIPLQVGFGRQSFLDTGSGTLNDITHNFELGFRYIVNNADPELKNSLLSSNGETVGISKLSFYMSISFALVFN